MENKYIEAIFRDGIADKLPSDLKQPAVPIRLSIVIPALNEALYIAKTLHHLNDVRALLGDDYAFEVLVVDNGSDDGTGMIVTELIPTLRYPVMVIEERLRGVGNARKTGGDAIVYRNSQWGLTSTGILFSDADTFLSPNFIMAAYERCLCSSHYLGSGEVYFDLPPKFSHVFNVLGRAVRMAGATHLGYTCPFGNALAISSHLYETLGGISDQITYQWGGRIKPHFGEDFDIGIKSRLYGFDIEHLGIAAISSGRRFLANPDLCDLDLFYHPEHIELARNLTEFNDISDERAARYWENCSVNMLIDFVLKPLFLDKALQNRAVLERVFARQEEAVFWRNLLTTDAPAWLDIKHSLIARTAYLDHFYDVAYQHSEVLRKALAHWLPSRAKDNDVLIAEERQYREQCYEQVFGEL